MLLGVFLVGAVKTFEAEPNAVRRGFIGRLLALGTLWFAAMPILVLVAMICAEYIQEPVSGTLLCCYVYVERSAVPCTSSSGVVLCCQSPGCGGPLLQVVASAIV